MSAPTLKLLTAFALTPDGKMPFIESLRAVLKAEMPVKTGYWLNKLLKRLSDESSDFMQARQKLFERFGKPVEGKPELLQVPPESMAEFTQELLSLERDLDIGLPEGIRLLLPDPFIPSDWLPLMGALDIFAEPE